MRPETSQSERPSGFEGFPLVKRPEAWDDGIRLIKFGRTLTVHKRIYAEGMIAELVETAGMIPLEVELEELLAWRRLPAWCRRSVATVEGVVAHPETIPRAVTGQRQSLSDG